MKSYLALLILASPIILARLIQTLGLIIGNLIVSGLGAKYLAASALATTISIGFITFASGNLYGISPLIAKEYGSKNNKQIMVLIIEGFYYATLLGLIISIILLNIHVLLKIFHEPPELLGLLSHYYLYFTPGILPMLWTIVLQEIIIGCQRQKIIYKYSLIRLLLGIFLAYGLVLGKFGFPVMGFAGLGLSIFLSSLLGFIGLVIYLCFSEYKFLIQYFNIKKFTPSREMLKLISFGLPIGIQMSGEILAIMFATLLIGRFGIIALAAQQITSQYLIFFSMIPFGLAHAIAARISKFRGENNYTEIRKIVYKSLIIIFILMLILDIIYFTIPHTLIHLYIYKYKQHGLEITNMAISFFYLLIIYQLFDAIRIVLSGILRGLGDSMTQMIIGIGVFWGLGVPLIICLISFTHLGPILVPLSLTISVVSGTILLSIYYFKKVNNICMKSTTVATA